MVEQQLTDIRFHKQKKFLSSLKRSLIKGAVLSGMYRLAGRFKQGAVILFYHGAVNRVIDPVVQETHIRMDQFEKQMLYLKKNYEVVTLDYINECIKDGQRISPSQVLITFDDGYRNNLYTVAPFLKSMGMPFAVFISTGYIDSRDDMRMPYYYARAAFSYTEKKFAGLPSIRKNYDMGTNEKRMSALNEVLETIKSVPENKVREIVSDLKGLLPAERWAELDSLFSSEEFMNWEEVRKLAAAGASIGSHCHDHAVLHAGQEEGGIDYQLRYSKELIEKNLGECRYFAYPNGRPQDISGYSLKVLAENNYALGLTTVPGEVKERTNCFLLPRIFPGKDIDGFKFALNTSYRIISRYYGWASKIKPQN